MDTNKPAVYDPLTRALHWLTVAGFIGILTTIVLWTIYEEAEWAGNLFGLHKSFGFLTLTVIALRIVWRQASAKRQQSCGGRTRHSVPAHACRSRYRHDPPIRQRPRPVESVRR